jgi:hypothetical protein
LTKSPEKLYTLLHDDVFKLGVLPVEEDFDGPTPETINGAVLEIQLNTMFQGILKKKDFRLCITLIQSQIHLKEWDLISCIFVPLYHAFQAEGAEVHVSWGYTRTYWYSELVRCVYPLDDIVGEWRPTFDWRPAVIEDLRGSRNFLHMLESTEVRTTQDRL